MLYEFFENPIKGIKVKVYPNGNEGSNKHRYTIERIDNDLVKKLLGSRKACREWLKKRGYKILENKTGRVSTR